MHVCHFLFPEGHLSTDCISRAGGGGSIRSKWNKTEMKSKHKQRRQERVSS